jgi:hypothetical protein
MDGIWFYLWTSWGPLVLTAPLVSQIVLLGTSGSLEHFPSGALCQVGLARWPLPFWYVGHSAR